MKKIKIISLFLVSIALLSFTVTHHSQEEDCGILKNSNFTYKNGSKEVFVVFDGDKHIEYHDKNKYYIKSDIEWITDCEYNLIIQETTIPKFPFDPGTKLHIKVDKVRGKRVYYTSSLRGKSWEGKLTKTNKKKPN